MWDASKTAALYQNKPIQIKLDYYNCCIESYGTAKFYIQFFTITDNFREIAIKLDIG